ncbi:hypothetical protein [Williamsia soli]|nr:hypothetical protein [Williamsia soli]
MPEPLTPFEMVGDADVGICVDGVCALPGAEVAIGESDPEEVR